MTAAMRSVGSGEHAVVGLHGWFGSAYGWGFLPEVVDTERFTYYLPEMRGYGARRGETGDYSMKEYAADAIAAADQAGLDRFSVIGHSMGAKAAAALLIQAPDRVRGLIGISPVAPAPVPMDDEGSDLFFGAPTDPGRRRGIIDFTTGNRNSAHWLDQMVAHSVQNSTEEAFAGALRSWAQDDYLADVGRPDIPIAVIVGEHDPALSAEVMRQSWLQIYPGCALVELPGCGHYPMHESPVALATELESILAGH